MRNRASACRLREIMDKTAEGKAKMKHWKDKVKT